MPKGYNDKVPPEFVPSGYLTRAENCIITDEKITTRGGCSAIGQDTGDKPILGQVGITTTNGVKRKYKFTSKVDDTAIEIWEWTGVGNWELVNNNLLLNVSGEVNCTIANDAVYCFDGRSRPIKITPGNPSTAAQVSDANMPNGSWAVWFHNFLFIGGDADYPNRVSWSDLGDPDDFTNGVTGYVDINPNDGDTLKGMNVLKDELIVFKRNRIWSLTGFGETTFTVSDINEKITGYGTVSHRSIINVGNDLYYLSHVGGEPEFRSLLRTRYGTIVEGGTISDDIQGTMRTLEYSQLEHAASEFDGRRAYFSVPLSGSVSNNLILVYDTVNKGWVKWTGLYASCFSKMDFGNVQSIYFGDSRNDSKVYIFDNSTNDNGVAINFVVETRRYGADYPERKKKWKYLYVTVEKAGDYEISIDQSPNGFTFEPLGEINLTPTGSTFPIYLDEYTLGQSDTTRDRLDFNKRTSHYLTIRYHNDNLDQPVAIRHWELLYKLRALRDS